MLHYQNPSAFKIHPIFICSLFNNLFNLFLQIFFINFSLFFTITVTPNPYPRSVSGPRILYG